MKLPFILFFTLLMSVQTNATTLNYSYTETLKELKACRTTLEGCTTQEELEIAKFTGTILNSHDLDNYLSRDTQKSIFVPLELNNKELLALAATTSLGVIAFKNDQEIMDVVQNHKSQTTEKIATVGNFLGTGTAGLAIAAGSYFLGVTYQDNQLKQVGLFIVGASMASAIVGETVKRTFGRSRPYAGEGPYNFFQAGNKSFYSGHTSEAFSIATVISEMYKEDYPIVPWVAYGVASITAYARVHSQAHWASDVIVGAIAGHLVTKLAMNAMNGNKEGRGGLQIYPSFDPATGAPMVIFDWTPKETDSPLRCSKMMDGSLKIDACIAEAFAIAAKK